MLFLEKKLRCKCLAPGFGKLLSLSGIEAADTWTAVFTTRSNASGSITSMVSPMV
jgi:hypothetical protein